MAAVPMLVSCEWLKDKMGAGDVTNIIVVDVSWASTKDCYAEYKACHIPGAHHLNVMDAEHTPMYPRNLPTEASFTEMARKVGINATSHVVVYSNSDQAGYFMSGRGWWTFKYFGHDSVSILDGGIQKWTSSGYPVTTDIPQVKSTGNFTASGSRLCMSFGDMRANIESRKYQICDSRPPHLYAGERSAGRIPGARSLPMGKLVNPDTGTLKTPDQLRNVFQSSGIDLDKPLATNCNSGMSSCTLVFAAMLCGATDLAVFRGGFTEWSQRSTPDQIEK